MRWVQLSWAPELSTFPRTADVHIACQKSIIVLILTIRALGTTALSYWHEDDATSQAGTGDLFGRLLCRWGLPCMCMRYFRPSNKMPVQIPTLTQTHNTWACTYGIFSTRHFFLFFFFCAPYRYEINIVKDKEVGDADEDGGKNTAVA